MHTPLTDNRHNNVIEMFVFLVAGLTVLSACLTSVVVGGTECYNCTNVAHVSQCTDVIQCPAGHICHTDFTTKGFTLGCKNASLCPSDTPGLGGGALVGREVPTQQPQQFECHKCCVASNCNRQLCQITVDGGWSPYSVWFGCSVTCGNGTEMRQRGCVSPVPQNGGKDCTGQAMETRACVKAACPVDGGWSPYSVWFGCSVTCGNGTEMRQRSCLSPAPSNGGKDCTGQAMETRACVTAPCPVDGGWSPYSVWFGCSVTCGNGTEMRQRSCLSPAPSNGGKDCTGEAMETRVCVMGACPGNKVDGGWSPYSVWFGCSVTCGNGTEMRQRGCVSPVPQNGGKDCTGQAMETRACVKAACPAASSISWGQWSSYGTCSVSCGIGLQRRTRLCGRQSSSVAEPHCNGDSSQDRVCLPGACQDGGWSAWGAWGGCDGGLHKRSRTCDHPTPSLLGKPCPGDPSETKLCTTVQCVDPQIGFTVSIPHHTTVPWRIAFSYVTANIGGDYDVTSGALVCTVPGVYHFTANLVGILGGRQTNVTYTGCSLFHNDKVIGHAYVQPELTRNGTTIFLPATSSAYVHLDTGDTVYLGSCTPAGDMNGYSSFTGHLVRMDCH